MNINWDKVAELVITGGVTLFVSFATVIFSNWLRKRKDSRYENILFELAVLRGKGVELRNQGERKPLTGKELSSWISKAQKLEKRMVNKASEISKFEGERLEWLDRVQVLRYPHILDQKQITALQNLSGMLIRADALLNKYRF